MSDVTTPFPPWLLEIVALASNHALDEHEPGPSHNEGKHVLMAYDGGWTGDLEWPEVGDRPPDEWEVRIYPEHTSSMVWWHLCEVLCLKVGWGRERHVNVLFPGTIQISGKIDDVRVFLSLHCTRPQRDGDGDEPIGFFLKGSPSEKAMGVDFEP